MSYYRRLIEESEKKRILGMHNTFKKNPTTRLINEALSDFPKCVMYAGPEVGIDSLSKYIGGVQLGFLTEKLKTANLPKSVIVVKQPNGDYYLWGPKTDKKWVIVPSTTQKEVQIYNYHCKCKNGKLDVQPIYQGPPKQDDTNCEGTKTDGNQQGGKDTNCRSKTPYNAITDMGMNFKDVQNKWIAANCNGTTPCIKGDATTNINLRNAVCDGTWKPDGTKGGDGTIPGGDVKLPDIKEIQACFGKVQLDMPIECKGTVMSSTGSAVGGGCIDALVKRFQETPQKMLEVVLCIFAKLQIPDVLIRIIIDYVSKNPQIIIDIINKNPQIIIDIITNNPQLIIDIIKNNPQIIIDIITKNPDIIKQIPIDKLPDILKEIPIEKLPDIIKIPGIPIQLPGGKTIEDILKEFPGSPIGNIPGLLPEKKQKFIEPIFPGKVRD